MDLTNYIGELKSHCDIVEVAEKIGCLPDRQEGGRYQGHACPSCGDESSKGERGFVIWPGIQFYKCYRCDSHGDVISLVQEVQKLDFLDAVGWLGDHAGLVPPQLTDDQEKSYREFQQGKRQVLSILTDAAAHYHKCLLDKPDMVEHLRAHYGLTKETIATHQLGYADGAGLEEILAAAGHGPDMIRASGLFFENGGEFFQHRIVFPYWKAGQVQYFIGRQTAYTPKREQAKYKKLQTHSKDKGFVHQCIRNDVFYGEDSLRSASTVFIAEGVTDCLAMLQAGYPTISPVTTTFRQKDVPRLLKLTKNAEKVFLLPDSEDNGAGMQGARKTALELERRRRQVYIIELPRSKHLDKIDVTDFLRDRGRPALDALIDEAKTVLAQDIAALKQVPKMDLPVKLKPIQVRLAAQSRTEREHYIAYLKDVLDLKFDMVKAIRSDIMAIEADLGDSVKAMDFVEEICNQREILYKPNDGLYEYQVTGYWKSLHERHIENHAKDLMGKEASANKAKAVRELLELHTILPLDRELNDRNSDVNLANGMFNLETRAQSNHDKDALSTVQLPIEYDPAANCELWKEFLLAVLDNDEEQIATLQEFMGYSFVADNRQEKAVCLLGPGANGKTTILTIWSALLGPANISSVPLHNLANQFHRVTLHGKLLNIASEISSQVVESEYFKKCVSGDLIDAAHKHKPTFTFMPYARFVFAMNRLPRILDTSYALYRRLLILEFPYIYKDAAEIQDTKYERVRDPLLDRKLLKELPGIFNWSLKGLDRLKAQGVLTVPRRHYELLEEYKRQNNPVLAFVEECCVLTPAAQIEKPVLYDAYRNFVVGGGYKALSRDNFFKELYTQYRGRIEDIRLRARGRRRRVVQGIELQIDPPGSGGDLTPPSPHRGENGQFPAKSVLPGGPPCPRAGQPSGAGNSCQPRGWSNGSNHLDYYYKSPGERMFSHSIVILTSGEGGPVGPPAWLSQKHGATRVGQNGPRVGQNGVFDDLGTVEAYIYENNIKQVAIDTETTSLIMHQGKLSLIQVYAGGELFLFHPDCDLSPIQRIIEDPEIEILFQNANFDLVFLHYHGMSGLKPANVWDTMIAERVLCGGLDIGYSLKDLVDRYLQIELIKDRKLRTSFKPDVELNEKQIIYAAQDVLVLPPIAQLQKRALQQNGLWDLTVFEMNLIPTVMDVSLAGMKVDIEQLEQRAKELQIEIDQLTTSILETLGQDIKINHGPTLRAALHEIGVKVKATAKENLVKVKHPIGKEILKYRKAHKEHSGFVKSYLDRVNRSDGRLHANFKQMGTVTGRFTCAQPNLQQVPRDGDIRSMFIVEPGHKLIGADFSQIELRIMAEVSGDTALKEIFNHGRDFHAETAARMYTVPVNQITSKMRSAAKTLNFGISYGAGIPKIAKSLDVSEAEAKEFRTKFFEPFAALRSWRYTAGQHVVHKLFSRTLWDRIRYFNSTNGKHWEVWQLKNRGINTPVQGTCGDLFKLALHWLPAKIENFETKIINLVHDEFVLEAPEHEVEDVVPIVKETLEAAGQYFLKTVPVVVDIEIRDNWAKA